MKKIFILAVLISILLVPTVYGATFNKNINYVSSATKDVYYNTTISFNPDVFSKVTSAKVVAYLEHNAETDARLLVNDLSCNPAVWTVKGGTKQVRLEWDCSNVIKDRGNYRIAISFYATVGTAYFVNIYGYVEVGYIDIEPLIKKRINFFWN